MKNLNMIDSVEVLRLEKAVCVYSDRRSQDCLDVDYADFSILLKQDLDILSRKIEMIREYERTENKLLYSVSDIPLLLRYLDCIQSLIVESNYVLDGLININSRFLSKWVKQAGWSKKSLIRHTLETQRGLIDDHTTLLNEILSIAGVKE